jgi:hypothetical protein
MSRENLEVLRRLNEAFNRRGVDVARRRVVEHACAQRLLAPVADLPLRRQSGRRNPNCVA